MLITEVRGKLTDRERFLMTEAFKAGSYYPNLESWLAEDLGFDGYVVEDNLVHDTHILFGQNGD